MNRAEARNDPRHHAHSWVCGTQDGNPSTMKKVGVVAFAVFIHESVQHPVVLVSNCGGICEEQRLFAQIFRDSGAAGEALLFRCRYKNCSLKPTANLKTYI